MTTNEVRPMAAVMAAVLALGAPAAWAQEVPSPDGDPPSTAGTLSQDQDEEDKSLAKFELRFDTAVKDVGQLGGWGTTGPGRTLALSVDFGLIKAWQPGSGAIGVRPFGTVGAQRNVLNLEGDGYVAADDTGEYYDVVEPKQVQLTSAGYFLGAFLRVAHPGGFLDLGGGLRGNGDGSINYYSLDTTDGPECFMDLDGAVNVSAGAGDKLYTSIRYGLFISDKMFSTNRGGFLAVELLSWNSPSYSGRTSYSDLRQNTGESVSLPQSGQRVRVANLSLGVAY